MFNSDEQVNLDGLSMLALFRPSSLVYIFLAVTCSKYTVSHTRLNISVEDLRTLATKDSPKDVTRLLDLLLVTNRKTLLTEEQEIRKAPYDLYNKELKGKFGEFFLAYFYRYSVVRDVPFRLTYGVH